MLQIAYLVANVAVRLPVVRGQGSSPSTRYERDQGLRGDLEDELPYVRPSPYLRPSRALLATDREQIARSISE